MSTHEQSHVQADHPASDHTGHLGTFPTPKSPDVPSDPLRDSEKCPRMSPHVPECPQMSRPSKNDKTNPRPLAPAPDQPLSDRQMMAVLLSVRGDSTIRNSMP